MQTKRVYSSEFLHQQRQRVYHNHALRRLDSEIVLTIRKLQINKIRKKSQRGGIQRRLREQEKARTVNHSNLTVIVPEDHTKPTNKLRITLSNIRSIKNKEELVMDHLASSNSDLAIIIETWLTDSEEDNAWVACSPFNQNGWNIHTVNRTTGRGGGMALIHKDKLSVKTENSGKKKCFEYLINSIKNRNYKFRILSVYHPPYSTKNRISNVVFLDDFIEFLTNIIPMYNNVLVVGDSNLHLNKADPDAEVFENSMDALGFVPHVKFLTHKLGNTLDQVYSELNGISIHNCHQGLALSDHYSVVIDTSIACSNSCATHIKTVTSKASTMNC